MGPVDPRGDVPVPLGTRFKNRTIPTLLLERCSHLEMVDPGWPRPAPRCYVTNAPRPHRSAAIERDAVLVVRREMALSCEVDDQSPMSPAPASAGACEHWRRVGGSALSVLASVAQKARRNVRRKVGGWIRVVTGGPPDRRWCAAASRSPS